MARSIGFVLVAALLAVACGPAEPDVEVGSSLPTSSSIASSTTATSQETTTTTTVPVTTTSLGFDTEERRAELEVFLGLMHGALGLDPNDEEYGCLTGDDVLAVDPELVNAAELAATVTVMCMPEQFLAAQLELNAVVNPDATESELAAIECVFRNGVAQLEGLDLDERIAAGQADDASPEVLEGFKAACDLTDEDLDRLEELLG